MPATAAGSDMQRRMSHEISPSGAGITYFQNTALNPMENTSQLSRLIKNIKVKHWRTFYPLLSNIVKRKMIHTRNIIYQTPVWAKHFYMWPYLTTSKSDELYHNYFLLTHKECVACCLRPHSSWMIKYELQHRFGVQACVLEHYVRWILFDTRDCCSTEIARKQRRSSRLRAIEML